MVGWGGNNGSTITASVIANKLGITWNTKNGLKVIFVFINECYLIRNTAIISRLNCTYLSPIIRKRTIMVL